jgi:hypothetical protein
MVLWLYGDAGMLIMLIVLIVRTNGLGLLDVFDLF